MTEDDQEEFLNPGAEPTGERQLDLSFGSDSASKIISPWLDIFAILIWLAVTFAAIALRGNTLLRVVLAVPVVLFLPGYATVRALIPDSKSLSLLERIGLSLAASIGVSGLIGFALDAPFLGIRTDSVIIGCIVTTSVMLLISYARQVRLPENERYVVNLSSIASVADAALFKEGSSPRWRWAGIVVILAILLICLGSFLPLTFKEGEHFTEFFIVEEPTDFIRVNATHTMARPVNLTVVNHEGLNEMYRIEGWAIEEGAAQGDTVKEGYMGQPLGTINVTVPANERRVVAFPRDITLSTQERIYFLLYIKADGTGSEDMRSRIEDSYLNLFVRLNDPSIARRTIRATA